MSTRMRLLVAGALLVLASSAALGAEPYSLNFTIRQGIGYCGDFPLESDIGCDLVLVDGVDFGEYGLLIVWVLVAAIPPQQGVDGGIGGVQFGIRYDPSVDVLGWALCTGGAEIPQRDDEGTWPESNTGNAIVWSQGCYPEAQNPDGMTAIGYLVVREQSRGFMEIRDDPRTGRAEAVDCADTLTEICGRLLGAAVMHSDAGPCDDVRGSACNTCGLDCATPIHETSWGRVKNLYTAP